MGTLTVTAKGQVTLRKEILKHLGVRPGEKFAVDKQAVKLVKASGGAARVLSWKRRRIAPHTNFGSTSLVKFINVSWLIGASIR